jgi:integrase
MPKLTKRTVDAAKPETKDYFIWDDEMPGYGLRVLPSGKKSYMVQYRARGRTRRLSFGRHGKMTPDEARTKARALLSEVDHGGDPAEDQLTHRRSPTVSAACERFMDDHVAHRCKPSTQKEYRRSVDLFIKPKIGSLKISDVVRADIQKLHDGFRHVPYQANRTLGVLSKLFNLCEIWGLRPDGSNPCRHVKKYPESKRQRYLSGEELKRLGEALTDYEKRGDEAKAAANCIRLLVLTGCRLGEIQTLKWSYVGEDRLNLPDSKTGAKTVYLGQAARDVLAGIERQPDNEYVIAGKKEGTHLTDMQRPWRRIRKMAKLDDVRIHDLRHTFASGAVTMGESLPMIGKLLGHSQVQTTARYAHLADDPVKKAAERISSEIAGMMLSDNRG